MFLFFENNEFQFIIFQCLIVLLIIILIHIFNYSVEYVRGRILENLCASLTDLETSKMSNMSIKASSGKLHLYQPHLY